MNILFIVPSYKPAYVYGGPVVCIAKLAERLVQLGHTVTVYTTTANGASELDVPLRTPVMMNGVAIRYFPRITGDHTHVSPALWNETWRTVKQYDAVHMHSWWNILIMGASLICTMRGVKPVLSPHGMLCDYVFDSKNQLKKKILHNMLGRFLLRKTHLHVSSPMEWTECLRVNNRWQGNLIYNLVELPGGNYIKKQNPEFTISFLSRIDPKKGLDILLQALARVSFPFRLQVAGSGDDAYVQQMKNTADQLGLRDRTDWVGWKSNEEKFAFLAGSDLFALTSHNENFAIVVIESLAVGTPVLVSEHVGLSRYVADNQLGWVTGIGDIDEVTSQLTAAYADWEKRNSIHQSASAIVRNDFNETALANGYLGMYRHLQAGSALNN